MIDTKIQGLLDFIKFLDSKKEHFNSFNSLIDKLSEFENEKSFLEPTEKAMLLFRKR